MVLPLMIKKDRQTETDAFLEWFHSMGNVITLGEIMQTRFGCEYRKHISLLRDRGINIPPPVKYSKEPSKNTYRIVSNEPVKLAPVSFVCVEGQMEMAV